MALCIYIYIEKANTCLYEGHNVVKMEGQEAGGHHTAGQRAGQSQSQGEVVCEHSRGHLDCGRGPRGNELSLEE